MENEKVLETKLYNLIDEKSNSNVVIQGLTGILGFPYTLIADGAVLFTHYSPMLNQIRMLYNRTPVNESVLAPILRGSSEDLLFDLLADKLLGQIPIVGVYFNIICAKTLTWRLGLLFAVLAKQGEEINDINVKDTVQMIRKIFPQEDSFRFHQPSFSSVERLLRETPYGEYDSNTAYSYTYE